MACYLSPINNSLQHFRNYLSLDKRLVDHKHSLLFALWKLFATFHPCITFSFQHLALQLPWPSLLTHQRTGYWPRVMGRLPWPWSSSPFLRRLWLSSFCTHLDGHHSYTTSSRMYSPPPDLFLWLNPTNLATDDLFLNQSLSHLSSLEDLSKQPGMTTQIPYHWGASLA